MVHMSRLEIILKSHLTIELRGARFLVRPVLERLYDAVLLVYVTIML